VLLSPSSCFDLQGAVEGLVVVELLAQPDDDGRMRTGFQGDGVILVPILQNFFILLQSKNVSLFRQAQYLRMKW
jgi:hypothetical protein